MSVSLNNRPIPEGGAWPTHPQRLLLQAALLSGPPALEAWQGWKALVDFEHGLDRGAYRLLPLAYNNIRRLAPADPLLGRLKGLYRLTWYKNQRLLHAMAEVLADLHAAGLPSLLLKGAGLTELYYRDHGLRPMDDFDVLVPAARAREAIAVLAKGGWRPKLLALDKLTDDHLALRQACGFGNGRGTELDLHWHVLLECCQVRADDDFWAAAVPVQINGVRTLSLNAADHLLHTCVHGLAPNEVPPVRWVADAMTILAATATPVDWQRLVEQAEMRRLGLLLGGALDFLRRAFDAAIPADVLATLQTSPSTPLERFEYRARTRPVGLLGALPIGWTLYLRARPARGPLDLLKRLVTFPRYLQITQGHAHVWQVFSWAIARGGQIVWRAFGQQPQPLARLAVERAPDPPEHTL